MKKVKFISKIQIKIIYKIQKIEGEIFGKRKGIIRKDEVG